MTGISLALASALALGQGEPAAIRTIERALDPGRRVEQQIAPGEAHSYSIVLLAGQFLRLAVEQDGIDVALTLTDPSGQAVDIDVADARYGREPVSVLAPTASTYRLTLRVKNAGHSGHYVIESEPPRIATDQDRTRVNAERALAQGAALRRKAESRQAALERFEAALRDWRALPDGAWEVETLLQRARVHEDLNQYERTIEASAAALELARRIGDRRAEARALAFVGNARWYLFDFEQSRDDLEGALALRQALGDRQGEGETLGYLAWVYSRLGEPRKQLDLARQALAIQREMGDRSAEAWALWDVGAAHANCGNAQASLDTFRETLPLFRALGNRDGEAVALQAIGAGLEGLRDHAGALAASEQALTVLRAGMNRSAEAATYLTMGTIYSALGDSKKAVELFNQGTTVGREIGRHDFVCTGLTKLGAELTTLREFDQASGYLEEALRLAVEKGGFPNEANVLLALGALHVETGRLDEARAEFRRVVAMPSTNPFLRASRARALHMLGHIANTTGDLAEARRQTEEALELLETARRSLTSQTLRSTYGASVRDTYELYVDVMMRLHGRQPGQGFDARALETSEMARARGLLDLLNDAGVQVREGVDPAVLEEERAVQDRLNAALDRQLRLSQGSPTEEQTAQAARAVRDLSAELDAAREKVRTTSPRFSALREPVPSTADEIRRDVLDADTVLLEYALGEKRSFLWVVSTEGLANYELPSRAVIEQVSREAYDQLAEPAGAGTRSAPAERTDAPRRLSEMILGPVAEPLWKKRLLIVADGALHYVPFAALPHPRHTGEPLLARHEIVGAPSASVVALVRRESGRRRAAARTLAVLADPVFERQDERLRGKRSAHGGVTTPPSSDRDQLDRALRGTGMDGGLPRLPFTRREAEAILSLVPARERKEALDFDASRATATDPSLADFRLVHFATHGLLNSAYPELSGIVLSLFEPDGMEARGFLTATDVFNLHLNAEMVVLSGCRTALGREMGGEGLVGLSRGFMYAGTPRVVASLWKVDDAATAELMKRLYRGILKDHLPPAAALRAAQLDLMRRPRFRHPFYWAAFQLQGEWR